MKRILSILLAMALFASLSTAVYAQDDLVSFSGTMRVMGFYDENYLDWTDSLDADKDAHFWQRFRLYTKFTPAEGVSAHLRTDFSERDWGSSGSQVGRPDHDNSTLHVDRAFLEIAKESFAFRAGQQYTVWGTTGAFDPQFTGYLLNLKFPVTVDLLYGKADENTLDLDPADVPDELELGGLLTDFDGLTSDEEEDVDDDDVDDYDTEDETFYGLQVGFATETFTVKGFFVQRDDDDDDQFESAEGDNDNAIGQDGDVNVFGLWTKMNFGMFDLTAELDVFGGDNDDPDPAQEIDYEGTQFYLGVGMKFSDAFRIGLDLIYAEGTDDGVGTPGGVEDAVNGDERQVTQLYTFGEFRPETLAHQDGDYAILPFGGERIMEPWWNAGIISAILDVEFAITDALKLHGNAGYAEPEEEDIQGRDYDKLWDDIWWVQAGVEWNFMEAASFLFGAHYTQIGFDGDDDHPANEAMHDFDGSDVDDDAAWGIITEVRVTF